MKMTNELNRNDKKILDIFNYLGIHLDMQEII